MRTPSIPYMGNKGVIAESIVNFIEIKQPKARYFYDLFGGGGSISTQAMKRGFNVHYNEIPSEWYDWVSRDRFFDVINSDRTDAYSGMVQQCYSFGNDQKSYLLGRNIEKIKEQLHYLVVNQSAEAKDILEKEYNLSFEIPKMPVLYDRYLKEYKVMLRNLKKRVGLERLE